MIHRSTVSILILSILIVFANGFSRYAKAQTPVPGDLLWSTQFEENVEASSPTVVDGIAYIAAHSDIFAIDITNGDIIWKTEVENPVYESPAVVNDVLYIGDQSRLVYALDTVDGSVIWTREEEESRSFSRAQTTVFGDVVYVSTGPDNFENNGWLIALDTATGDMKWEYETVNSARENSPVVASGIVYIGDNLGNLYAVRAADGEELWVFESGHNSVYSSVAVQNGIVYTVINEVLPDDGTFDVDMHDGYIYALDAETGDEIWPEPIVEFAAQQGVTSSPAVFDGKLYVGIYKTLFSIDAKTASIDWRFETDSFISSSPTIADGVVFVGSHDYSIYAIDIESGTEEWSLETPYQVRSSPIVVDGVVYIGADLLDPGDPDVVGSGDKKGYLYAIDGGVNGSSQDSRVQLGTINHHFGLNPFFNVSINSLNTPVKQGDDLEVTVNVKNFGLTETQMIRLENFNGDIVDQQEVTLDRSQSEQITLRWQTAVGDAAYGDIIIRSDDKEVSEIAVIMQEKIIGCEDISIPGYYTLSESVSVNGTCIHITSSYVELDGGMNTITGIGVLNHSAIVIEGGEAGTEYVTVKNITIEEYGNSSVINGAIDIINVNNSTFSNIETRGNYWGIWAEHAENMLVENSVFEDHGCCYGIYTENSPEGTYKNLEFTDLYYSLWLRSNSHNSTISGNEFQSNYFALMVEASNDILISDNNVYNSTGEFGDLGDFFSRYNADNLTVTNLRTGKTDASEMVVSFDAKNAQFMTTESPGSHPDLESLNKYFKIRFSSGETRMDMDIHYNAIDPNSADVETLGLWFYNEEGQEWTPVEHAVINTSDEILSVNITETGAYGVFSSEVYTPIEKNEHPVAYRLEQNYPNPFNPTTNIRYSIPEASDVQLEIFNAIGQRVSLLVDKHQNAGWHEISFDAGELSSGMYIYRMQAGTFVQSRQLILIK